MKHTKIVCTIGPSSRSKTKIKQMIQAGMNVARVNFSHADHADHAVVIKTIRTAALESGRPIAILQDLQGPRIRTGVVVPGGIAIVRGDRVVLLSEVAYRRYTHDEYIPVPIQYPQLSAAVKKNGMIYIQDGTIALRVSAVRGQQIYCTVKQGGVVQSHKGINAPGADLRGRVITTKDREDVAFGVAHGVDAIALSFVKDANNIRQLRKLLPKKSGIHIIAKIERLEAVEHFDEIMHAADGIMIARGDLGVEIGSARVPILQKEMVMQCVRAGKPVIVATQMLESMTENPRPTRAEAADVANAVIDHADALMLSAETATGAFPLEAVRTMTAIAREVEKTAYDALPHDEMTTAHEGTPIAVAHASVHVAQSIGAHVVAVLTKTGDTATALSQLRPKDMAIVVATADERVLRQMSFVWGVHPVHIRASRQKDDFVRQLKTALRTRRIARAGDEIVVITNFSRTEPGGVAEVVRL